MNSMIQMAQVVGYIAIAMVALAAFAYLARSDAPRKLLFGSGRRFLFVWASLTIATVAMFTGIARFAEWSTFTTWLGGVYIAANVGEKWAEKVKNGNGTKP